MTKPKVAIVGAGLGGLATAARLASRGCSVDVYEARNVVGGRCHSVTVGDVKMDGGPTLLMMLEPFQRLFSDLGERFEDHVSISLCEPNNRVFFADGTRIDATANVAKMKRQIEAISGPADAASYVETLGRWENLYREAIPRFVRRNYDSVWDLADPVSAITALRHGMLGKLAPAVKKAFQDPRLRVLFSLQTMYLGLSPASAPAVYGVLSYMEYAEGIWYPQGGLNTIPIQVAQLAQRQGANIHLNSSVARIEAKTVVLETGERIAADVVVCNADLPYAEKKLLPTGYKPKGSRRASCSAFMHYIDYEGDLPEFSHHNIVLPHDFDRLLNEIFVKKIMPNEPAFYAAISSRTQPDLAPPGHINLFLLTPYPNLERPYSAQDGLDLQDRVFTKLERDFGFDRAKIRSQITRSPADWRDDFHLDLGAAFGLSADFFQSVCFRASNKSPDIPGLYFVGAGTVPGNGLPMVLISAELVEKRLEQDRWLAAK